MNDARKLILKVLLACLAIAAATGVLAVLSSSDVIARVTGTAAFAAGCALVLLGVARLLDKPVTQAAGLVGMVVVVLEFLLGLALIWELPQTLGSSREDSYFLTCWLLIPWGIAAMVYVRLLRAAFTRVAGIVGLITAGVSFFAALVATWLPGSFWEHDRIWVTAWVAGPMGLLAVLLLIGLNTPIALWTGGKPDPVRGSPRHWRWIGIVATLAAAAMALHHTWIGGESGPQAFVLALAVACWLALVNVATLTPLKEPHRWVGAGTIITAAGTALLCVLAAFGWQEQLIARGISATAIPTACGCLALIVMARLSKRTEFVVGEDKAIRITLLCPRCRRRQDLPLGGAPCEGCGLKIEVKIEEPRCTQCGYMLYMLTGNSCPECGAAIETKVVH